MERWWPVSLWVAGELAEAEITYLITTYGSVEGDALGVIDSAFSVLAGNR